MLLMTFDTEESRDKLSYLYKTFRRPLLRAISRFVSDSHLAEDIVEQAFIVADKHLEKLDVNNPSATYGYLWRIVDSQYKDYFRRTRREPSLDEIMETNEETGSDFGEGNPLEEIIRMERIDIVREALSELPESERRVLELYFVSEMKYHEIGELLKIPTSSVGVKIMRAKEHLKRILVRKGLTE
ncbi:RNA polymerase sigma factor [Qiania dongpingensis]|uniref:Sigma-70 family RNA polymerase sigma factor n=1 Tax=Qiania dongpingensis TaxID=2763669 RepID=A0A7G9G2S4_9FIRM|nr:sigma-70 family RNA polymerase sigma factor [Qiania dongpingensis]QNM05106.1 sigma-70 family RNA polymerase sigma factor [Qiania dongpingensis]